MNAQVFPSVSESRERMRIYQEVLEKSIPAELIEHQKKKFKATVNKLVGRKAAHFERRREVYKAVIKRLQRKVTALRITAAYNDNLQAVPVAPLCSIKGIREFVFPSSSTFRYRDQSLVYFLVDQGHVVYVGQTVAGFSRPFAHVADKTFQRVFFVLCPRCHLDARERKYIDQFMPKYNKDPITQARRTRCAAQTR